MDPSHSVPKDSLKKHLRKCRPEKVRSALYKPYFSPDINSGSAPINILNNRGRTHQIEENKLDLTSGKSVMNAIREMPRHDLMRFVERVEFIFKQAWKEFHEQAGSADVIAEKLETLTTETAFETVVMSHPSTEPLTQ